MLWPGGSVSEGELRAAGSSLVWTAAGSEAFGPPLPLELEALLLHSSVKSSLMVLVVVPSVL